MGENNFATWPVALYRLVQICSGCAYMILEFSLIKHEGKQSRLAAAVGTDIKGKASILLYAIAIPIAFVRPWLSCVLYVIVAIIWLVPDRRIERIMSSAVATF
jgi:uncharacterized membrane protein